MRQAVATLAAFVSRDWVIARSYRVPFATEAVGALFSVTLFYYLGRLVGRSFTATSPDLAKGYFAFAVIGIATLGIGTTGLSAFAQRLRQEQTTGTLEALVCTPCRSWTVVVGSAAFDLLRATVTALVMVLLGVAIFGLRFTAGPVSLVVAAIAALATVLLFGALGVALAAFTVVFKQAAALLGLVTPIIALLSGVYFPIDVLPQAIQKLAEASPFTWALDVLRAALLRGVVDLGHLALLVPFAVLAFPFALYLFERALRRARREGSLTQY